MAKLMLVMKTLALTSLAPKLASRPPSAAVRAKRIDRAATAKGLADNRWAAAPGDGQAEHQQGADDLRGAGDGDGEDEQERRDESADRDAAGLGCLRVDEANSRGRYQTASRRRRSGG